MITGRLLCAGLVLTILSCGFVFGQGTNTAPAKQLYLLAATPTENINYSTNRYPTVLYRVNPTKKLDVVSEIVSEKDGSAAVQAVGDVIFVIDQLNFTVHVIHTDDPARSDSVPFNADHRASNVDDYGITASIIPGSSPDILLPVIVSAGESPPISALVSISSSQAGLDSRVQINKWNKYGALRREGTPGIPILALPFVVRIDGNNLVYNLVVNGAPRSSNTPPVVVDSIPPSLREMKGPVPVAIEAANAEYLVLRTSFLGGPSTPSTTLAHYRAQDAWKTVEIEGNDSRLRLFGQWLATDVEVESSGPFLGENPEKSGERDSRTSRLPNVYGEYGAYCWLNHRRFPGVLVLQNLEDNRKIRIETHQEDSEILWVSENTVLYRMNDSIYQAEIAGDKIQRSTLVVKDDDVPEVHWVFWSK